MSRYIFIVFLFLFGNVGGQNLRFDHIPLNKGLSSKSIPAIIQDRKGYLWFATQDGLNRFDGYSFKVFQKEPGNKNSLSNNNIFCLYEDSEGIIWIGTEGGGLTRFDADKEEFSQFINDPADPFSISSNQVYCIEEAKNGELWLGTWDAGITVLNKKTGKFRSIRNGAQGSELSEGGIWDIYFDSKNNVWISLWGAGADRMNLKDSTITHFKHIPGDPTSISDSICGLFHEDADGFIWITTWGGGLNKFDPSTEKFKRFLPDPSNPHSIGGLRAWPIVEDNNGFLWIGVYDSGLNRFDKKTEKFTVFGHDDENYYSISNNNIWSLFIDHSGILWIGTEGGGIDFCSPQQKNFKFFEPEKMKNSLSSESIRDIIQDKSGNIWLATWLTGIDKYDPREKRFTNYRNNNGETGLNRIRCVYLDRKNTFWFGSYRGGLGKLEPDTGEFFFYDDSSAVDNNFITEIYEDADSNLWVASLNDLRIFDRKNKVFVLVADFTKDETNRLNTVNVIRETKAGLLFGTNLGVFIYNNDKLQRYRSGDASTDSLFHNTVYDIKEFRDIIWVATRKGLISYFPLNNSSENYSTNEGLPGNVLFAIEKDDQDNLWISSDKGLSKFKINEKVFVNYNLSDDIRNLIFYPGSSLRAADGTLYFGGTEGVTYFHPSQIEDNGFIPPVHITGFYLKDELHMPESKINNQRIELSYNENVFSFHFVGLNYSHPEKNQYAYMLEGFDTDWHYCGSQRTANYTGLPPGEYTFHVRASNNDGVWNTEGASVSIIIYPPFWETWWFRFSVLFLLLALALTIYRLRVRSIRQRNIMLEKTVKERTEEVVHQKEQIQEQKKEILDSIHYAKRIQNAILTPPELWKQISPEHFVFFRPKDIVSGDFYWAYTTSDNKAIWTVADCTGHGVPGAFMSMIGNSFLNEIVIENNITSSSEILERLRMKIIGALQQKGSAVQQKDGMDMALCIWDKKTNTLEFSGANNPLYMISNNELIEVKADKMPIGAYAELKPFGSHLFQLNKNDRVYLFSDGFADQFGGEKGKKYKYSQFKDFLLRIQNKKMNEQLDLMENEFEKWKGQFEQIDDVCIIGIEIA